MSTVTSEQIQSIGDHLRESPRSWKTLHYTRRNALITAMRPDRLHGFSEQQAAWIYGWLLEVSQSDLLALQALHPRQYAARESVDGDFYLSAALLTDALDGRSLSAALPILEQLTMVDAKTVDFPQPEAEI